MASDGTEKRFVAVLNKKIEVGKSMNALAHMTAGLVGSADDTNTMGIINYADQDGSAHLASKYPYIVLKAKNSNQIRTLRNALTDANIPFASFTDAMTVGGYQEQMERSKSTPESDLEYYGICFFGDTETIAPYTKKFSLYS